MKRFSIGGRSLGRRRSGFRSPLFRPTVGIALLAFGAVNLLLVLRLMADSDADPTNPGPSGGSDVSVEGPSLEQQRGEALRRQGRTRVGASTLFAEGPASVFTDDGAGRPNSGETSTQPTGVAGGSVGTGSSSGDSSTDASSTGSGSGDSTGGSDEGGDSEGGDETGGDDTGDGGPGGGGPGGGDSGGDSAGGGDSGGGGGGA